MLNYDDMIMWGAIFTIGWKAGLGANYIQLKGSGKFLDAAGGDGEVNVWQYEGNGTKAQNWFFEDAGGGWFYIRNMLGYYLDVENGKDANSTNVRTHTFNAADAEKWKPVVWTAPKDISSASVSVTGQTYTGNALVPRPTVTLDGAALVDGTDYEVIWSDNTNAGTGHVTLTGKGSYTGTKTASFQIAKAAQSVTVTKKSLSLAANKSANVGAKSTGNGKLTYKTSNTKVATVTSSGVVKAVGAGNASITVSAAATSNYKAGTVTVKVAVTRLTQKVTASNKTTDVGKSVKLGATTSGNGKLTYKSSNASVATVSAAGVVTGKKPGKADVTITAATTSKYANASKTVTITVKGANTLTAARTKATVTASFKTLKSKSVKLASNVTVGKAKGAVSYANASSNATAKTFKVNAKNGDVTIPKGTKKGTYAVKVKVAAKGTTYYYAGSKTVTYKVKVK